MIIEEMKYNSGDFRSDYCTRLLNESDIVVTNPPFSLFREFFAWLMKADKKFIIVGNQNAITYKELFPSLRNDKCRMGYGGNITLVFQATYVNTLEENRKYVRQKGYNPDEGYIRVPAISWFTNCNLQKHHEPLILVEKYTPEKYPKYDNYDAIEVSKVKDIPCDYDGVMGVPITYMYSHNPEQFEILGAITSGLDAGIPMLRTYNDFNEMQQGDILTGASGGKTNGNPVLVGKPSKGNYFYNPITKEYVYSPYKRIAIKRR